MFTVWPTPIGFGTALINNRVWTSTADTSDSNATEGKISIKANANVIIDLFLVIYFSPLYWF
jgi:hypothetical protein